MPKVPALPPPQLPISELRFVAKLDYIKFLLPKGRRLLFHLDGRVSPSKPAGEGLNQFTIHDVTPADVRTLIERCGNARLVAVEVAVDMHPKAVLPPAERLALLHRTFMAAAARFRPEDATPYGHMERGALSSERQKPLPLERRFATPAETVIYGGRNSPMNSKLYLKVLDHGIDLPMAEWFVRTELTLERYALAEEAINLKTLSDLVGFRFRKAFSSSFRIIQEPRVRKIRGLTPEDHKKMTRRMDRAWRTAGVGKFALPRELPAEMLIPAIVKTRRRQRVQLPYEAYQLMRDVSACQKFGQALLGLERGFRSKTTSKK